MGYKAEDNLDFYLKVIEYKRSIGTTQWAVMSIFITASEAVLAYSMSKLEPGAAVIIRIFGLMIYWLGFFLYLHYRSLNKHIGNYLMKLEKDNNYNFQEYLSKNFHQKKISSQRILFLFGIIYTVFAILISIFC